MPKSSKKADCHPERPHVAHGLCKQCWSIEYNRTKRKPTKIVLSEESCACGCGQYPRKGFQYIQHHWSKSLEGRESSRIQIEKNLHTPEVYAKISSAMKGHSVDDDTRNKISRALTGVKLSKERVAKLRERVVADETRKKLSENSKRLWRENRDVFSNTWSLSGKSKHTEETKQRMSVIQKIIANTPESRAAKSARLKGRIISTETREKISKTLKARYANVDPSTFPTWKGGIFIEYPESWREVKSKIRLRDGRQCLVCGTKDFSRTILSCPDCHHVDGDKHNLKPENLICLCRSCHMKAQRHMDESIPRLHAILSDRYGYVYD